MHKHVIEIRPMTEENQGLLSTMDSCSSTEERIVVTLEDHQYSYDFVPVASYTKVYDPRFLPVKEYFAQNTYHVLFAYVDDQLAGQVILDKSWNRYGHIDDIRVGTSYKGMGVGSALIRAAEAWAKAQNLNGMMLETQDINAPACKFYLKSGYHIGSVDLHRYKMLEGDVRNEVAILFYKFFDEK